MKAKIKKMPPSKMLHKVHKTKEQVQKASNRAPRRRGREVRRSGRGDCEGVGLVTAVVERSVGIGDGDG
ncbi:Beta-hexosaminidase 2 [Senna tora]|uniref:Beta-hexosaminidase 2 n=1 Tax=Senna tora TaxID=362788 RepID=A0A834VXM3_9FABA|nr:Beta-hexosaminidase 2 [Senna tora]